MAEHRRHRVRRLLGTVGPLRPPLVTLALMAAVTSTAWRLGVFGHEVALRTSLKYGFSGRALTQGRWGTVITSQFLTRNSFMTVSICVSLLVMLGVYEALAGSMRALLVAVVCGAAGPLVVAGGLGIGSMLGLPMAGRALSTIDYGASAITAGGGGAVVGVTRRRYLRLAAVASVLGGLVLHHQLADWEHLVAFPLGWCAGRYLGRSRATRSGSRLGRAAVAGRRLALGATAGVLGVMTAAAAVVTPATMVRAYAAPAPTAPSTTTSTQLAAASPIAPPSTSPVTAPSVAPSLLSPADVVEVHYATPSLGGTRRMLVLLPPGYTEQKRKSYPVVELLHGDPGNPGDVVAGLGLPDLANSGELPPFIGVAPDGHGPRIDVGDWADSPRQALGAAVSDDLRRFVDTTYRTDGSWYVMGLSSGAYGAAYLGHRGPGMYDAVCAMSGFFTARAPAFAGATASQIAEASPLRQVSAQGPRTLLLVGSGDSPGVVESKRYAAAMQAVHQPAELRIVPGIHDWPVWKAGAGDCLRFLLVPGAQLKASHAFKDGQR